MLGNSKIPRKRALENIITPMGIFTMDNSNQTSHMAPARFSAKMERLSTAENSKAIRNMEKESWSSEIASAISIFLILRI